MAQTRVVLTEPNGVERSMPLTPRGLSIGRAADNNLVIDYPTTSRYHAEVRFENRSFYIVDLNSGNGTRLGNVQLSPNQPTVWRPGTPVEIGGVTIQLELGQEPFLSQPAGPASVDSSETILGWLPGSEEASGQGIGSRAVLLALVALGGVICVCLGLGVAGYFFFGGGW